ncbi:MAG TPA: MFS transporter [Trebonia sp.]|jgi:MFS family permease|nr:MFS transporter [Trebonia sp.]
MNHKEGTIRAALGYPAFRSLLAGLAVSQVGDWLYNLALVTMVYQRTGSALWAGIATAARVIPIVVLGPLAGVVADRFGRRGVMIASDLARLLLMLGLALVAAAHLPVLLAPLIAALATAAGAPYLPCVSAVTQKLVRGADLTGANAARSAVTAAGVIAGPALGGVLLLIGPPATAFVVNALTFGAAAVFTVAIKDRRAFAVTRTGAGESAGLVSDIADGAAALRAHPAAIRLVGADIMCSLVYGMQTVLLILVARHAGLGLHGYGYLFAAIGAGGLIGTAVAGRVARLPQHVALAGSLALVGLPTLAMPAAHWAPAAILLAGFTGAGALCVEIMTETGLQRMLDDEVFGRAYGLALPASIAGIALGSLIAPVLVSGFGETAALLACGAVVTAYGAVAWRATPASSTTAPTIAPSFADAPVIGAPTVAMPALGAPSGPVPMFGTPTVPAPQWREA